MSKTLKALIMVNSKPIRAAFELNKLQAFLFHLTSSTLNLINWFMCSKQILFGRKLWPTLYIHTYILWPIWSSALLTCRPLGRHPFDMSPFSRRPFRVALFVSPFLCRPYALDRDLILCALRTSCGDFLSV